VLNIIIQNISEKEDVKEKGSKGTSKTLKGVHQFENLESNLEGDTNNTLVGLNHKVYQI